MSRVFGAIPKIPVGSLFRNRQEVAEAGVHRPLQAGISGAEKEGAESVVLSGGYEDDQDHGDVVIYTGHGGNDPHTGQQIADQELTRGNLALARNQAEGLDWTPPSRRRTVIATTASTSSMTTGTNEVEPAFSSGDFDSA